MFCMDRQKLIVALGKIAKRLRSDNTTVVRENPHRLKKWGIVVWVVKHPESFTYHKVEPQRQNVAKLIEK